MSKKIMALLFFMLVLISISAVSAAGLDDNNGTIVSSSDGDEISVGNNFNTVDDLYEDDADDNNISSEKNVEPVVAGKNNEIYGEIYEGAEGDSMSPVLGMGDYDIDIEFDQTYDSGGINFMCMILGFSFSEEISGTLYLSVDNIDMGSFPIYSGRGGGKIASLDAGNHGWNARFSNGGGDSFDSGTFTIDKQHTSINIHEPSQSSIEMCVGESTVLEAVLSDSLADELTYSSSDENVAYVTKGEQDVYPYINARGVGTATITLSFAGNKNYEAAEKTITVTVSLNDSVVAEDMALNVGENGTIMYVTDPDGLNVSFVVDDSGVVSVDDNGIVTALKEGVASINITVGDGKEYAFNSTVVFVTVNLNPASVSVNNSTLDLFVDDNFTIVATTDPEGLNVTYVPDNSGVVSVDENGVVTALKEGTATITVKVGDGKVYAENSTTVSVTVSKVPTEIIIQNATLDMKVGDEIIIVAILAPASAGNVTFTSSDYDVVDFDDEGNVIAQGKGQAIITVSFAGDNKYTAAENKTINVTVSLNDASVTVDNDTLDLKVGETYAIKATKHPDTILLDITYTSSNNSVATVDENGIVTAVGEGTAIITVEVGDDEIYAINSTNVTVTISKIPTEIVLANETVELKAHKSIGDLATLSPAEAGNLTYTSSDEDIVLVSEDGIIYARIKGTATVTVSFAGNDKYGEAENKTITVTVTLNDASVSTENDTINLNVDDSCIINATANPSFLAVHYASSNESVAVVTDYGNVKAVGEGTAIITLTVGNGETYAVNSTYVTVTVTLNDASVSVDNSTLDLKVGDTFAINATTVPAIAKMFNVTYTSSDESVVMVDENGTVTAMDKGNAIITVEVGDDRVFAKNSTEVFVTVHPIGTYFELERSVVESYSIDKAGGEEGKEWIVATLRDANGQGVSNVTVQFTFDGEIYNLITDENGTVRFQENKRIARNYTGTFVFLGDETHYANMSMVTVVVKQKQITISASAKTYKVKAKTKKYTVTLKTKAYSSADGKAHMSSGYTVKFKINGKTYSGKTNSKGQVTFNLKLTKKGKYSGIIRVESNKGYKGASKSVKITVK